MSMGGVDFRVVKQVRFIVAWTCRLQWPLKGKNSSSLP